MTAPTIQFFDNYRPTLDAGDYVLTVKQVVGGAVNDTYNAQQALTVLAPRFSLPPADVHSVFPPKNADGTFVENLPHVVLNQRALPWERFLVANDKTTPWLAVLLFVDGELVLPTGTTTLSNPTGVGTYPLSALLAPPAGTLGPNVTLESQDDPTSLCQAIDVPIATFTKIAPTLAELPYLTHARQVNTDAKVTAMAADDGWFSIVIGNRFPQAAAGGLRNIVHLVSLEGFSDYLQTPATAWPAGIANVRLASLASWTFTCEPDQGSYSELMMALVNQQAPGGDGLRLRLPASSGPAPTTPAAQGAQQKIAAGYVPLEYETRAGVNTFAWYRGPLTPQPIQPFAGIPAYTSAAAATIYDPGTGTFDLSYATAWEIGRMLAISDRAYAMVQQTARRAMRRTLNLLRERTTPVLLQKATQQGTNADLSSVLASNHVSTSLVEWMTSGLAPNAAPNHPAFLKTSAPKLEARPPLELGAMHTQLTALLSHPAVQQTLQAAARASANNGPIGTLTDWLSRLRLLYEVPFGNLVADSRMLPPESIRFFYVDSNYLDALVDGAQSVAMQTSRDVAQYQVVRTVIHEDAQAKSLNVRATLTKKAHLKANVAPADGLLGAVEPGDGVAGFLLRSQVVSGWPGLEVHAFRNSTGGTGSVPVDLVRMDHLAPDVLLCLFAEVPAWVEIDEPKEALAFGQDDTGAILLRAINDPNAGSQLGTNKLPIASYFRNDTVLDTAALQAALKTAVAAAGQDVAKWGPAAFAIQMVRAPQQMIFQNAPNTGVSNA